MRAYLGEHVAKQHVQPGIILDSLLEFLDDWVDILRVGIYMFDRFIEKLVMMPFILREPVSSLTVSNVAIGLWRATEAWRDLPLGHGARRGRFCFLRPTSQMMLKREG
jgi:hypothetical protein